jgi:hypothetical protein
MIGETVYLNARTETVYLPSRAETANCFVTLTGTYWDYWYEDSWYEDEWYCDYEWKVSENVNI